MPDDQPTITPTRAKFFQDLKAAVGPDALRTIDPKTTEVHRLPPGGSSSATRLERYPCSTQKPMPITLAGIPSTTTLQVGNGKVITRWKTGPAKTINYAVFENGYPEQNIALLAASKLKEAADEWNGLELGIRFNWVHKIEDAAFVLSYAKTGISGVLAESFFPNTVDLNVLNIYPSAFKPGTVPYLKNIFLHELGHILGFRHEFAPETKSQLESGEVSPRDPISVMGYGFPPTIQESDVKSAQAFYNFEGKSVGSMNIVEYDANN